MEGLDIRLLFLPLTATCDLTLRHPSQTWSYTFRGSEYRVECAFQYIRTFMVSSGSLRIIESNSQCIMVPKTWNIIFSTICTSSTTLLLVQKGPQLPTMLGSFWPNLECCDRCSNPGSHTTINLLQHVTINDFCYPRTGVLEWAVTRCDDRGKICDIVVWPQH